MMFDLSMEKDFRINIGAHKWHVKFVDLTNTIGSSNDDCLLGVCLFEHQTILISDKSSYSMRLSTFFHELIHAFECIYDIKISHQDLNLVGDALSQVLISSCKAKGQPKK